MSIFIIDRDTPGISATKLDKLGWKASDTAEIAFDNVQIPLETFSENLMLFSKIHVRHTIFYYLNLILLVNIKLF